MHAVLLHPPSLGLGRAAPCARAQRGRGGSDRDRLPRQLAQHRAEAPGFVAASLLDDSVVALPAPAPVPGGAGGAAGRPDAARLAEEIPAKGPARRLWPVLRLPVPSLAAGGGAKPYLGVASVPLPPAAGARGAEAAGPSARAQERRKRQEEVEVRALLCAAASSPLHGASCLHANGSACAAVFASFCSSYRCVFRSAVVMAFTWLHAYACVACTQAEGAGGGK